MDKGLEIVTNNVPRNPLYGCELTPKEKKEFDYISDEEIDTHEFVRYHGVVYDTGEFMRVPPDSDLKEWDGYRNDSYFSGIVLKYVDGGERVIMGTFMVRG